jgi:hypothetical protein
VFLGEQEDRSVKEKQLRISCEMRWLTRNLWCLDYLDMTQIQDVFVDLGNAQEKRIQNP